MLLGLKVFCNCTVGDVINESFEFLKPAFQKTLNLLFRPSYVQDCNILNNFEYIL